MKTKAQIIFLIARIILGGVFIYASYDKILHPEAFAKAVHNYQILPDFLINLTAIIMPWLELIIGGLLLFGIWQVGTIILVNSLLIIFISAMLFNLYRGIDVQCGCFSSGGVGDTIDLKTILRDISFLILGMFLFIYKFYKKSK